MKLLKNSELIGIALLLAVGLSACGKPGPAEIAGKKIDQTADDAVKKINQAADKVGDKIGEQGFRASVAIDDAEITAKIKAAIFAEPGLKSMQISVDTIKGVVTLTGSVSSKSHSDMAKGLASAVAGVREVDNRLMLKPIS